MKSLEKNRLELIDFFSIFFFLFFSIFISICAHVGSSLDEKVSPL